MWSLQSLMADPCVVSCAAAVVACVAVSGYMLLSAPKRRAANAAPLDRAVQDSIRHAAELATIRNMQQDLNQIAGWVTAVEKIDRRRYEWPRIMSEVAGLLPPEAWIVRLDRSAPGMPTGFRIEGRAWSEEAVEGFRDGLDSSPSMVGVQVVAVEQVTNPAEGTESGQRYHRFLLDGGYEIAVADAADPSWGGSEASP